MANYRDQSDQCRAIKTRHDGGGGHGDSAVTNTVTLTTMIILTSDY